MNLVIDIGNTRIKFGLFEGDKMLKKIIQKKFSAKPIPGLQKRFGRIDNAIISDVATITRKNKSIKGVRNSIFITPETRLPFINKYESPSTLGSDRVSLVAGALKYFPGKNVLVISAGTCITYDFINNKKEYLGGSISPGLNMRFAALHHFTAELPLVKQKKINRIIGNSTVNSILTGVINGMTHEMDGFINEYKKSFHDVQVILTGGDADWFALRLKNSIFAVPDLTLFGLNEILKLHVH
jgi:type III pantothenate kinase